MADAIETAAAEANIKLAEMTEAYRNSPEMKLELDKLALERMRNDPHHQNLRLTSENARNQEAFLEAKIRDAEAGAEASLASRVLSDPQRVDLATLAINGDVSFAGPRSTVEPQIPIKDFSEAIQADLAADVPEPLVKAFYGTGLSDDRMGHVAAELWFEKFNADPEWQALFMEGDRTLRRKFRQASMYLSGKHPGVTEAEERVHRAKLLAAWGW
jgi:hypothetical protein